MSCSNTALLENGRRGVVAMDFCRNSNKEYPMKFSNLNCHDSLSNASSGYMQRKWKVKGLLPW
jgi:hypothetical protein